MMRRRAENVPPKPLRAKANGIINIMGYLGGACATVLGLFLKLSDYIVSTDRSSKLMIIEIPFIVASLLRVVSAFVLFFTIKENKLAEEMKDEMEKVCGTPDACAERGRGNDE